MIRDNTLTTYLAISSRYFSFVVQVTFVADQQSYDFLVCKPLYFG